MLYVTTQAIMAQFITWAISIGIKACRRRPWPNMKRHRPLPETAPPQFSRCAAAYQKDGWRGYGRQLLQQHLNEAKRGYVSSYYFATDYAMMGDKENVLAHWKKVLQSATLISG